MSWLGPGDCRWNRGTEMAENKKIMVLHSMISGGERKAKFFAGVEDVEVVSLSSGVEVVESRMDHALCSPDAIRKALEAEKDGFKAIVFSCHGDPDLYPMREAVRIPVLGTMQVAMHFCAMLAGRFSIMVPSIGIKRDQEDNVTKYGLQSKVASIRVVPFKRPIGEISQLSMQRPIPEVVLEPVLEACTRAIEDDDACGITFGCGCFTAMAAEVEGRLKKRGYDLLVINPLPFAVEMARSLIRLNMSHSARAYPPAVM
jgi:allantoin racemase